MNTVNFGSDSYGVEESQLANKLRMAQEMQMRAMDAQPLYSGRAALAKALLGGLAGFQMQETEKQQRDLAARKETGRKSEIEAIFREAEGQTPGVQPLTKVDDEGNAMPSSPGQPGQRMTLARLLAASSNPAMAQAGLAMALKGPEKPDAYTLKPGERRMVGDKVLAEAPVLPKDQGEKEPESVRALKAQMIGAGIDPESDSGKAIFKAAIAKATTHQPGTNVSISTGKKLGETLATNIGEQVAQSADAARGAVDTLTTAKQINDALASGKVMAGPGTSAMMFVQQALGAPSTEEGRVKTREVIQGLSQMTLAARKQLKGQGQVSDFEGKLLAKAASGDIDSLTIPEIKTLVTTATRLANGAITQHKANLQRIQNSPDLKELAPFFDITTPAAGSNPNVDDLLKKYGG